MNTPLIVVFKPPVDEMSMEQRANALELVLRFRAMEARGECRLVVTPLPSEAEES